MHGESRRPRRHALHAMVLANIQFVVSSHVPVILQRLVAVGLGIGARKGVKHAEQRVAQAGFRAGRFPLVGDNDENAIRLPTIRDVIRLTEIQVSLWVNEHASDAVPAALVDPGQRTFRSSSPISDDRWRAGGNLADAMYIVRIVSLVFNEIQNDSRISGIAPGSPANPSLRHNQGLTRVTTTRRSRRLSRLIESLGVDHIAIHDEGGDAAGVPDVLDGVSVDHENVCAAAGSDLAQLVPAELQAVVVGGGGQSFARGEPQAHQQFQLGMHGDARQ